jgi:hypothetical protein
MTGDGQDDTMTAHDPTTTTTEDGHSLARRLLGLSQRHLPTLILWDVPVMNLCVDHDGQDDTMTAHDPTTTTTEDGHSLARRLLGLSQRHLPPLILWDVPVMNLRVDTPEPCEYDGHTDLLAPDA